MVTCIDICSLYRGKRGKAILLVEQLASFKHKHLVEILKYWVYPDQLIFIETEAPKNLAQWKTFVKKKITALETLNIFESVVSGLSFLHMNGYTHRDVHPSRIAQYANNVVKFNTIGFPYNFKKLLKRDDFSGHINYSAPELILERPEFTNKVDIWALGCTLFYIIHKQDPFDGKEPQLIKKKILNFNLLDMRTKNSSSSSPSEEDLETQSSLMPLLQACFNQEEMLRPTCTQLLQSIT